ncbi:MAG: hypothetical protein LBE82_00160 [Chitinophagaceae bacterium]|jgi:hypothetical protein|nr:hypothetical protein [Chitinophagaceae bacterium]
MAVQMDLILAQLKGFKYGKQEGNHVIGLVAAMGLTKGEWERMKIIEDVENYLEPDEIETVEKYFENRK